MMYSVATKSAFARVALRFSLCLLAAALAAAAQGETKTIVLSGQSAPGTDGGYFSGIGNPTLNASGQVAFWSGLGNANVLEGIFRGDASGTTAIALQMQGTAGSFGQFAFFGNPVLNASGQVAFWAHTWACGTFRGDGVSITAIPPYSSPAPGVGGGMIQTSDTYTDFTPALNDSGQIAFYSALTDTTDGSYSGIFRGDGVTLTAIVREKWAVSGTGGGTLYSIYNPYPLGGVFALNASGQVAFRAEMADTTDGSWRGVFRADGSTTTAIVRNSWAATGAGGGTFDWFANPILNDSGQTAYYAELTGTTDGSTKGLFRGDGATPVAIARQKGSAPGTGGGKFAEFPGFVINALGQVAFRADLTGSADGSTEGVFRGDGLTLAAIARNNWAAPGPAGQKFGHFYDAVINASGQVAFRAALTNPVGFTGVNEGIFLADDQERIVVVRTFDALEGSTVSTAHAYSNGNDLSRSYLNDYGQVAFYAKLADNRQGSFVFTPELHWRAAAGGSWDTATNWTVGLAPAGVHPVTIDPTSSLTVTGPTGAKTVKSLTVGAQTAGQTATLTLSSATGSLAVTEAAAIQATGCLNVNAGTFTARSLANAGTVTLDNAMLSAATITNTGTIRGRGGVTGAITNNAGGVVAPGASPGILTVEDITFADGSTLQIELGGLARGTEYDVLAANGTLALQSGSSLELTLISGFVPHGGDEFDIMDFTGVSGEFSTRSLPALGEGLSWDTSDLYTSGTITVAPEPATLALVAFGIAGTLLRRRRR